MARSTVEVWARGFEVGRVALGVLMDVQGMLARRQTLDVQLDLYAMRSFGKHGGSDALTLGVLDFDGNRFRRGGAVGLHNRDAPRQNHKAHNTGKRFYCSSRLIWGRMNPEPPDRYTNPTLR